MAVRLSIEPFSYTAGRWLKDDAKRQSERKLPFDYDRLCQKVLESAPGAQSITSCIKHEGGFNRVFIMSLDNGQTRVARIPYPGVGLPPRFSTASEVATVNYVQQKTKIPVPKILDWSSDSSGPIGTEYIIMEEAQGVSLATLWDKMNVRQHIDCIEALLRTLSELSNLEFRVYGSLYHRSDLKNHSEDGIDLDDGYCIGPHCDNRFWSGTDNSPIQTEARGPFQNFEAYINAIVKVGIARVEQSAPGAILARDASAQHGSAEDHIQLLETARSVLTTMGKNPTVEQASVPTLYHPDLNMRNIFVSEEDTANITAIIDWQGASIEPSLWYSDQTPDFAIDTEGNESESQVFAVCSAYLMPRLWFARQMDQDLSRPFLYVHRTWNDGISVYRQELIELEKNWEKLGMQGKCPFHALDTEALAAHEKQYNLFRAAQMLKKDIAAALGVATDGWVPRDMWEEQRAANTKLFESAASVLLEGEDPDMKEMIEDEEALRLVWPFDLEADK